MSVKSDIGNFYENLSRKYKFRCSLTQISGTYEDFNTYYCCRRNKFATKALLCNIQYCYTCAVTCSSIIGNALVHLHCNNHYEHVQQPDVSTLPILVYIIWWISYFRRTKKRRKKPETVQNIFVLCRYRELLFVDLWTLYGYVWQKRILETNRIESFGILLTHHTNWACFSRFVTYCKSFYHGHIKNFITFYKFRSWAVSPHTTLYCTV